MTIKRKYTKLMLTLSICALILWSVLGTGTSLAWFTDVTPVHKNIFHIGEMDLVVSYLKDGDYYRVTDQTSIFDNEALYEPGYVQVVYLRIENQGDVPFDYKTAVTVTDYLPGKNVFGQPFLLQEYLLFGVLEADTEAELTAKLADREAAEENANEEIPMNTFLTGTRTLNTGEESYMALIVRMPKEVGNIANYNLAQPRVDLGLIVKASQVGTPIN